MLDLSLGGEFGGALLEELAQLDDAPAVVICSAFTLAPLVAARFSVPCVKKPLDLDVLIREVQRAVDQRLRPRRVTDAPLSRK